MSSTGFGDDDHCFVCGSLNEYGLRLSPRGADGTGFVEWTPSKRFQGYTGIVHGGIISALLDEAMAYAALSLVPRAATAEIRISFRSPVSTEGKIEVHGKVTGRRGRILSTSGELVQNGEAKATATAKFVEVPSLQS